MFTGNKHTVHCLLFLTFDANEHELVERQCTVVGHNIGGFHTAQADLAEVLLAGETRQGHISQICFGVFCHFSGKENQRAMTIRN